MTENKGDSEQEPEPGILLVLFDINGSRDENNNNENCDSQNLLENPMIMRCYLVKFFKDTSLTMIGCYIALITIGIVLFTAVVTGSTSLPQWACVINYIPFALVLMPFRIGGAGNWSGAAMFLVLMFMI